MKGDESRERGKLKTAFLFLAQMSGRTVMLRTKKRWNNVSGWEYNEFDGDMMTRNIEEYLPAFD